MKYQLISSDNFDSKITDVIEKYQQRIQTTPLGVCPVAVQLSLLQASRYQTCAKCVPCRDGLPQLENLMQQILDGKGTPETLEKLKSTAQFINNTADCAIGYNTAKDVLDSIEAFREDYESHVTRGFCADSVGQKIPCVHNCPAHVDIPGYIALAKNGDPAGAINLIRRDNPLPTACAMICEHPCEERCRRTMIDAPLNIRGIKKYAVDQIAADKVATPKPLSDTGKKIAIIGGGPAGLSAAYYLSLMGHRAVIFERQEKLGGMLRYGIPEYRFPKARLDEDINAILSTGNIEVRSNVKIGEDISIADIRNDYDAMFVAIGAQKGKTLKMDGNDAGNVYSAVDILDKIGHGQIPDYTGKTVVVIGGGNVAMDCARSAIRCGADVKVVYRRRKEDMTALVTEIDSAAEEGVEFLTLQAPEAIEKDADGNCAALIAQPQMIGAYKGGRPAPKKANLPANRIACDVILIAVGQDIESAKFEEFGMPANRNVLQAGLDTSVEGLDGVFTGGDCATGPATAIRAVAAGKVAAYNIDAYLGFNHTLDCGVEAPPAEPNDPTPTGRVNIVERPASERKHDFKHVETEMTLEEALQEAGRCLRCDHYGCGLFNTDVDTATNTY
jgi:NADPH-dependent glutamate synthase beta subunit-like oxidoreductase